MPKRAKTPEPAPSPAPKPRRKSADLRLRIMDRLTAGLSVAKIARAENLTVRRIRQIVAEMLASRDFDPAAGFVQIQIARLNEAMIVAHTMMTEGDLAAMDRFIKLAAELDRYHGFFPGRAFAPRPSDPMPRLAPPETPRIAADSPEPDGEIFLPTSD